MQSKLSTTTTLGTEESGRCRNVAVCRGSIVEPFKRSSLRLVNHSPSARDLQALTLSKTENVSVFYEFTGIINHRFLTNHNARTILAIL